MNGYDMICEAAEASRTTRMPEAASIPGTAVRPRNPSPLLPEFDASNAYRLTVGAASDGTTVDSFRSLTPGAYCEEAAGSKRSDGESSQDRNGGNRYDISTPEKKRKALAAARRSDNPEDLKRLRGKVAESALLPPLYPREAVSSGDFPAMGEAELTAKKRNKLPKTAFAIPGKRAYPIQDLAHARNALARVAQFGTPAEKKAVRAAVYRRYPQLRKNAEKRGK